jgi:hypothetical protein
MFPDYGVKEDIEELLGSFNPFNLLLCLQRPLGISKERDLIMRGEFEEAKVLVRDKFFLMNADERLSYIFKVTSGLHELRHFHDYFGTSCGFARLLQVFKDGIEFNKLWDQLKQERRIKLPLAMWAKAGDAPDALKTYLSKRQSYIEWLHLFDGSMRPVQIEGKSDADQVIIAYSLRGLQTLIPAVPRNFNRGEPGVDFHKMMPLGARALMEGSAFTTQLIAAGKLFGPKYFDQLKAAVMLGSVDDDEWIHYMTVDLYLSKHLGKFYSRFQLALSDISMMAADPIDITEWHPGWRLSKAVAAAKGIGPLYQKFDVDLADYMNKITKKIGWNSVNAVAKEAIVKGKSYLIDLDSSPEGETLWASILRAAYSLHLAFMTMREKVPEILADPAVYFVILSNLPPPPAFEEGSWKVFQGFGDKDANAFQIWFLFEHMQRQLMFSTKMPCPGGNVPHACPGDPLTTKGWRATDRCPFSQFVTQMGVPGLAVERV